MPTLTERLQRIRKDMMDPAYDDRGYLLPAHACVHADDLRALLDVAEAARDYVRSCRLTEGLVTVRAPNPEAGASSDETWRLFDLLEGLIGGGNAH